MSRLDFGAEHFSFEQLCAFSNKKVPPAGRGIADALDLGSSGQPVGFDPLSHFFILTLNLEPRSFMIALG